MMTSRESALKQTCAGLLSRMWIFWLTARCVMADLELINCICVCLWIVVQVNVELLSDLTSSQIGYRPSCRLTATDQNHLPPLTRSVTLQKYSRKYDVDLQQSCNLVHLFYACKHLSSQSCGRTWTSCFNPILSGFMATLWILSLTDVLSEWVTVACLFPAVLLQSSAALAVSVWCVLVGGARKHEWPAGWLQERQTCAQYSLPGASPLQKPSICHRHHKGELYQMQ